METNIKRIEQIKYLTAFIFLFDLSSEKPVTNINNPKKKFIKGNALKLSVLELS